MPQFRTAHLYPVVFLLVLLVAVGGLSYVVLRPFFSGILWAAVVAVALWPLWAKVRARAGKRLGLAAGLFTLAVALVVLLPVAAAGRGDPEPGGRRVDGDRAQAEGERRPLLE